MQRVIVTGANGFIGSGLLRELSSAGYEIYAVVRSPASDLRFVANLDGVHFVYCEMSQYESLDKMLPEGPYDALYHLAWEGAMDADRANAFMQLENCKNTLAVALASKRLGCKKFIATGTITEFVAHESIEKNYVAQNVTYAIAKQYTHALLNVLCNMNDIRLVWAVMANTFGVGKPVANIIFNLLNALIDNEETAFTRAEQPYDCIFLEDAARALRLLGECENHYSTYLVGSGQPRILKDYLLSAANIVAPSRIIGLGKRPEDRVVFRREWFNNSALREDTNFEPAYTFEEGIQITANWLRQEKGK